MILGAGFTRAFFPSAPLLVDTYELAPLLRKYRYFAPALRILKLERDAAPRGMINIERLMTRLDGRMPYDYTQDRAEELGMLLSDLKHLFIERLREARRSPREPELLATLASYVVQNQITCVTFNYDDFFDEALWRVRGILYVPRDGRPYWHPDGGYGFFVRPAESTIKLLDALAMDEAQFLLLKLHGSMNWRVSSGYSIPYSVDTIMHLEDWLPKIDGNPLSPLETEGIERHLEDEPFILPPVLVKSNLVQEPALRVVWTLAFKKLQEADRVIFIGYSFPAADLASAFIFRETLSRKPKPEIIVVNNAEEPDRVRLRNRYLNALGSLSGVNFVFKDAYDWATDFIAQ